MKNKLAYLGFLGLLGFAGFIGTPLMFSFFANFIFFKYIKVVPDELFWDNIRTCATRGFFVFLVPSQFIVVITLLMAVSDSLYSYATRVATGGFSLTLGVSVIVFSGTLDYLELKEKRSRDNEDDG